MFGSKNIPAKLTLLCLTASSAVSAFPSKPVEKRQADCAAVHIFLAKGWNEPYPGRQGKLAGAICYGLDSCDYEDIYFYNTPDAVYCDSVTEGDVNGVAQMTAYADRCPDSQLVLSGYSQGANVAGDILGGGGTFGNSTVNCTVAETQGLDPTTSPGNKIAAALLFGDNRHVADQSYNVLSGANASADNPRSGVQLERLNAFAGVLRSYCVSTDPVCAPEGGSDFDVETHLNYFDLYSDDAAGWVKWILENPPTTE